MVGSSGKAGVERGAPDSPPGLSQGGFGCFNKFVAVYRAVSASLALVFPVEAPVAVESEVDNGEAGGDQCAGNQIVNT